MPRTAASPRELPDPEMSEIQVNIVRFLTAKKVVEDNTKTMKQIQPGIVEWMKDTVEPDDNQNYSYPLEEPIEGYVSLKLQRAVSTKRDDDEVFRILRERGLFNECTRTVVVPDDDAIAQAAISGRLSDEDMEKMFPIAPTYRLMTPKK